VELVIDRSPGPAPAEREVEVVERKGLGHPDTICDAIAEAIGVALCSWYLERFDAIQHHNVDKVLLVAGRSSPDFGGGEVLEPIELVLAGRAAREVGGVEVPVDELAVEAARGWLREHLRELDAERHVRIDSRIRPGSRELVETFSRQGRSGAWLANDTSCGVGYAPLTALERTVLAVEGGLRTGQEHEAHPELGEDVKVMGVRRGDHAALTVADAFVGRHVRDLPDYAAKREQLRARASDLVGGDLARSVEVEVNTADDLEQGDIYLTVTGTSAEAGDDGEAGRGNRANGLITPYRPMTMESVAGKNPVSHVGKIYNVTARRIAEAVVDEAPGIDAAECRLVSRIGQPVTDPWIAHVHVHEEADGALAGAQARIEAIVREHLSDTPELGRRLARAELGIF